MKNFARDLTGDFPNGTWRAIKRDGVAAANFCCPLCGFRAGLGHGSNHEIASDGSVSPSVVCDGEGCTFHEYIKLEGWQP
jgi:hypothetical protein